ncbi:hypothetical protein [Candidatus Methylomirabilis sp.]|uniref:hypothetical protein n=1 Tax=Candidatus Methylomirabilis sp. TaxID=2032687 RepID=UPI003075FBD8
MNNDDAIKMKIAQGGPRGWGHGRGCGALELEAEPTVAAYDQEIEFGTAVCGPEKNSLPVGRQAAT